MIFLRYLTINLRESYINSTPVLPLMTSGAQYVWTDFPYDTLIDPTCGWLLDPQGSLLILFDRCKKSARNNIQIYTHLFYANYLREPERLKNTRLLNLYCAFETWNELQAGGWTLVSKQFQQSE